MKNNLPPPKPLLRENLDALRTLPILPAQLRFLLRTELSLLDDEEMTTTNRLFLPSLSWTCTPPSPPGSASTPRPSRSPRPTLNSPRSSSPTRSRSPLRRPIPSTSPPTNRGRRTTTNLPADYLSTYKRVLRKYHDPQNRRKKIEEIYTTEKISRRTWHRKRPIAELQILDSSQFDELLRKHLTDTTEDRLNQEVFGSACSKILKRPALIAKRRRAVAAGQLI